MAAVATILLTGCCTHRAPDGERLAIREQRTESFNRHFSPERYRELWKTLTPAQQRELAAVLPKLALISEYARRPAANEVEHSKEVQRQFRKLLETEAEALEPVADAVYELADLTTLAPPAYDPFGTAPTIAESIQRLVTAIERFTAAPGAPVKLRIRSVPAGADFKLLARHEARPYESGKCDATLLKVVRGKYTLRVIGLSKECSCEIELFDNPPATLICDLSTGGECSRE